MGEKTINVLSIGENTHSNNLELSLTSRALGASEITFVGKKDTKLVNYINGINKNWGGKFKVSFAKSYEDVLKRSKKYIKIYLTRYGQPLQEKSQTIRTYRNIVLIVTFKENKEMIYKNSDFNISVTAQPHSSAASIAIFLHEFYKGRELAMHFENAKYKLINKDKKVEIKINK